MAYDEDVTLDVSMDVEDAKEQAESLRDYIDSVLGKDGSDFKSGLVESVREQLEQARADIEATLQQLQRLEDTPGGVDTAEYADAQSHLQSLIELVASFKAREQALTGIVARFLAVGTAIKKVGVAAIATAKQLPRLGFNLLYKPIQMFNSVASTAVVRLKQMASATIRSGIIRLTKSFLGLKQQAQGTSSSLLGSVKNLVLAGVGIQGLSALFNKLKSATKEGFGNLAQYSDTTNQTISRFISALNQLKLSLTTAFAPIVNTVLPILTSFIKMITEVINKIGMLIATLTGQSAVTQAVEQSVDYAASMADTAKDTADATKEIHKNRKELEKQKKTLAGFDDVEILRGPDSTVTPDIDTKSITPGAGGGFITKPIESAFSDLANKLRSMWQNADFTELGAIIGTRLKEALERIPWNAIKEVLRNIAKSIATLLNGFLEVPGLFTVIGKTIAEALNSAFEFVYSFVRNFHWDSLGTAIKDGILGFLTNIDWDLIFATLYALGTGIGTAIENAFDNEEIWTNIFTFFGNKIQAFLLFLNGLITAVNWGSVAKNIATGLNTAIQNFNWTLLSNTLSKAINAVFSAWFNFVSTFNFTQFGQKIGSSLSTVIKNINWKTGGYSLGKTITGIFEALNGFVTSIDWKNIGKSIVDFIAGFFRGFKWSTYGNIIGNVITAIWDTMSGIIQTTSWWELPSAIFTAIGDFMTGFDWTEIAKSAMNLLGSALAAAVSLLLGVTYNIWTLLQNAWGSITAYFSKYINDAGGDVIAGLLNGIVNALKGIGTWILNNIFKPFIDGFKKAFGISSPSTKMKEQGGYIIQGLLKGITGALSGIGTWIINNIFTPFKNGLTSAFNIVGGIAGKVKDVGSSIVNGIKGGATSVLGGFKSVFTDAWTNIKAKAASVDWKGTGSGIINTIKTGANSVTNGLKNVFSSTWNTVKTATKNIDWKGLGSGTIDTIKSGVASNWKNVSDKFKTGWDGIKTSTKNIDWKGLGSSVTSSVKSGVSEKWKDVSDKFKTGWDKIKTNTKNINWKGLGSSIITSIKNGISSMSTSLSTTAKNTISYVKSAVNRISWRSLGSDIVWGIINGMNGVSRSLEITAHNLAVSAYNAMVDALDIGSPSKLFRDEIGKMIPAGMAIGIEKSSPEVIDSMLTLADDLTEKAQSVNPLITVDTAMSEGTDNLGSVLTDFSTTFTSNLTDLVNKFNELINKVPDIAKGNVVPSTALSKKDSYNQSGLVYNNSITKEELRDVIDDIISKKMNISFYIGDEQIARHSAAGAVQIERRLNPVTT